MKYEIQLAHNNVTIVTHLYNEEIANKSIDGWFMVLPDI